MTQKPISLVLTIDDVTGILNVLGELPSKTGAWTLMRRIQEQVEPQIVSVETDTMPAGVK